MEDQSSGEADQSNESKEGKCFYHLCRKQSKTYRCGYCGDFFCGEHLKAKPPYMPNFGSNSRHQKLLRTEWREHDGHPCPPYVEVWEEEQKAKSGEYYDDLNKASYSDKSPQPRPKQNTQFNDSNRGRKHYKQQIDPVLKALLVLSLLLLVLVALNSKGVIKLPDRCSDGTANFECSRDMPLYCLNDSLVRKASMCGCPGNYDPEGDECIAPCSDGTFNGACSGNMPFYCQGKANRKNRQMWLSCRL